MKSIKINPNNHGLVRRLVALRKQFTEEHERIHREAEEACEALSANWNKEAGDLSLRILKSEGLDETHLSGSAVNVMFFEEHGDAFIQFQDEPSAADQLEDLAGMAFGSHSTH